MRGGLLDLSRPEDLQGDLFQSPVVGNKAVMDTLDAINRKFGRGTAGFAASGWKAKPAWGMRQKNVSPCFTTKRSGLRRARRFLKCMVSVGAVRRRIHPHNENAGFRRRI